MIKIWSSSAFFQKTVMFKFITREQRLYSQCPKSQIVVHYKGNMRNY